jgi:hypothetical protein
MPAFSLTAPVVCLADIKNDTSTSGRIGDIYDVRTFTSDQKEATTVSSAVALGMLVDAGTSGISPSNANGSLYATVVATDGSTSSTTPNAIVTTLGAAWIKATSPTSAGQYVIASSGGYSVGHTGIPNNSFYYSVGNARTSFDSTCNAANNCSGSVYVFFNVR